MIDRELLKDIGFERIYCGPIDDEWGGSEVWMYSSEKDLSCFWVKYGIEHDERDPDPSYLPHQCDGDRDDTAALVIAMLRRLNSDWEDELSRQSLGDGW